MRPPVGSLAAAAALAIGGLAGCGGSGEPGRPAGPAPAPARPPSALLPASQPGDAASPIRFADVTEESGLAFTQRTGARGKKWMPESMGSGVLFADLTGDDLPDLLFASGTSWPGDPPADAPTLSFHRNLGGCRFRDETAAAGLGGQRGWSTGLCAGDLDGDGDLDVFATGVLGAARLLRNDGGRFVEAASPRIPGWTTSCTFLDADGNGTLDLFAAGYVEWTPETDIFCSMDGVAKTYCTPREYRSEGVRLFLGDGKGGLRDATGEAGLAALRGKSLGVLAFDADGDGRTDIAVANDTQPGFLLRNLGGGRFEERGVVSGIGLNDAGVATAGMGIDAADWAGTGSPGVAVGNFANELISLYRNDGRGFFLDASRTAGMAPSSLHVLTFGLSFADLDLDGRPELLASNGHIEDTIEKFQEGVRFAEPPLLYWNRGGRFVDVTAAAGGAFAAPRVARGHALADCDRDGDLDLAVSVLGGQARLFRNDTDPRGGFVRIRLDSPARAGSTVRVTSSGSTRAYVYPGASSYLSQGEDALLVGLGPAAAAEKIEVVWPDGARTERAALRAGGEIRIAR